MNVAQKAISLIVCFLALLTGISGSYSDGFLYDDEPTGELTDEFVRQSRAVGMKRVAFPCNGHDHLARCLHGGRGPRKTMTKAGRFCVCVCSPRWLGPECGYLAESLKKRFPWSRTKREDAFDELLESQDAFDRV